MSEPPFRQGSGVLGLGRRFGRFIRLLRNIPTNPPPEPPLTPPGPPTNVSAYADGDTVHIGWTAPVDSGNTPLASYLVTPRNVSTGTDLTPVGVTLPAALITGLSYGVAYTFTVQSVNMGGLSSVPSAPTSPVTTASVPGAPTSVVAVGGVSSLFLSWTAPNQNLSPITNYRLVVKNSAGTIVRTIDTGNAATSLNITALTNDIDYYVEVKAQNSAGFSTVAGISNTVNVNWTPVDLPVTGLWTSVAHPLNNPLRLRISRESGGNGGALGLSYNHIVDPGDGAGGSLLTCDHPTARLVEGDVLSLVLPMWFPTEDWPAGVTSSGKFFEARTPTGVSLFSFEATHNQILFKVGGVTRHTRAMQTNTRLVFRLNAKISINPLVGYVELRLGTTAPGSVILAQEFRQTMFGSEVYAIMEAGLKQSFSLSTRRRVRHNAITATITTAGVPRRVRLDADADVLQQMQGTTPYVGVNGDVTYANMEAAGTQDRVQLIMHQGELCWQFRVYAGDLHSSGQRSEIMMASRWTSSDHTLPQKQFLIDDKIVLTSKVWFPTDTSKFHLGTTGSSFMVEEQLHQLSDSGGSPPHEINPGTDQGPGFYGYRHNDGPDVGYPASGTYHEALSYSQIANPLVRGQWYTKELTVYVHEDPTKGYVQLKVNGVTVTPKIYCRTNHLAYGQVLGTGEVLGTNPPEQLSWKTGLYLRRGDQAGGFNNTNEVIHGPVTIRLYRNPTQPVPY